MTPSDPNEKKTDLVLSVTEEKKVNDPQALTDAIAAFLRQDVLQAALDDEPSQKPTDKLPGILVEITVDQWDYRLTIQRRARFALDDGASNPG